MKNKSIASLSLRKLLLSALVAAPLATLPSPLWALPANQTALNNVIVSKSDGVTATSTSATRVDIASTANNSVVVWTEFGSGANTIGATDTVNFALPSASASILNRVSSSGAAFASLIEGSLLSNGNIVILNPNGVTIGASGIVSANSLRISTQAATDFTTDAFFLSNGELNFAPTATEAGNAKISAGAVITAASNTGNVWVTAKNVEIAGTINANNVAVNTVNNGSVILASDGNLTVGHPLSAAATVSVTTTGTGTITVGNATLNSGVAVNGPSVSLRTANGIITQVGNGTLTIGPGGTANSTLTTNSGTGATTLTRVANNGGNTLTVSATGAAVNVTASSGTMAIGGTMTGGLTAATSAGDLIVNASTVTGAANLTAGAGNIVVGTGDLNATTGISLTADAGRNVSVRGKTTAGGITFTNAGNVTLGDVSITGTAATAVSQITANNISVTTAADITQSGTQTATGGNVSFTSTAGNITLSQNVTAANLAANANQKLTVSGAVNGTPNVTLTAGTALAVEGALTASNSLTATAATITQTAAITAPTATLTANTITLENAGNDFGTVVLKGVATAASVTDANSITLGNGTATTGNVTLTGSAGGAGTVALGTAATDVISVGGFLKLDNDASTGAIADASDNVTVFGGVTALTGTGTVILDGSRGDGIGLNSQYGQIAITTSGANATVLESTTLNLGNINLGTGDLTAYSATGIINTGRLQVRNIEVGAGTAAAQGDIALNYTHATEGNSITGTVTVMDDSAAGVAQIGNYLARSLSVTAGATTGGATNLVHIPVNRYGAGIAGPVTITTTGAANLVAGDLVTTGAVTLNSGTGSITATSAANIFPTVTVTSANTTGASAVTSKVNLTVNGNISGTQDITFTATGSNLTIGNFKNTSTAGVTKFVADNAKAVTDSVAGMVVIGDVLFQGGSVTIDDSGHSFGKVDVTTSGNGNATIVESGSLRLGTINVGTGRLTATSQTGSVLQRTGTVVTAGSAVINASTGGVTLTEANKIGTLNTSAKDAVSFTNAVDTNVVLGNVSTGGNLTVATSGTGTIGQASGSSIFAFGATSFTTVDRAITVANAGNRFGPITLNSGTAAASLREDSSVNLRAVTSGALTVVSDNGDIIDTGTGSITPAGAASFQADKGSITLDLANSNYGTTTLKAGGSASIIDNGGDFALASGSAVTGNLTITNSTGNLSFAGLTVGGSLTATTTAGNIAQTGAIKVTGDAEFRASAAASSILLTTDANEFGTLRFLVGTGGAEINQVNNMVLRAGTIANGQVVLYTGGNFSTTGDGASSFLASTAPGLKITAVGTIIPGPGSLLVLKGLTVFSNAAKDLSNLSLSGNLVNIDPTNQGAGAYTAPKP